jgi:NAD-dependent SIR2 family protein deacetylase
MVVSSVTTNGSPDRQWDATNSLADWVRGHPRLFVLTGAGCSTDSGIPDYRDQDGNWKRKAPLSHQDFLRSDHLRRRYWARSMIGWRLLSEASPNAAHYELAEMERTGYVHQLVTQNVDGLHQRAGSKRVIDLHGRITQVLCLVCGALHPRAEIQALLEAANSEWLDLSGNSAPDGDADVEPDALEDIRVPDCPHCGGLLKPDVVFFGDTVPKERVSAAMMALEESAAMLVVGSSLSVFSGYRFCLRAKELGRPIAAINLGHTRADEFFAIKVKRSCGETLASLAEHLSNPTADVLA